MKTYYPVPSEIEHRWLLLNAENIPLGRLAAKVAILLRGKHKPIYTPHLDTGDHVIVINIGKVALTGNKRKAKIYRRHSSYPGGMKETLYKDMDPVCAFEHAVRGMLPKNPLGRAMFRKLKAYVGVDHPHQAQSPQLIES